MFLFARCESSSFHEKAKFSLVSRLVFEMKSDVVKSMISLSLGWHFWYTMNVIVDIIGSVIERPVLCWLAFTKDR